MDPDRAGILLPGLQATRPRPNSRPRSRISSSAADIAISSAPNTIVVFDQYDLLPAQVTDPVGNIVTASSDYRVLQPKTMTDPNGNQSAVAFDALGLVVGTAVMDKSVTVPQDSIDPTSGFMADLLQSQIDAVLRRSARADAAALLGNATSRIVYDFGRFAGRPARRKRRCRISRRQSCARPMSKISGPDQTSPLQVGISFSDGFGREIQKKVQADPGPLVPNGASSRRRAGSAAAGRSGTTRASRSANTSHSSPRRMISNFGAAVGVSSTLFYDPLGRVFATLHPDQSWEKVTFDPWRQGSWDANDTIRITDPATGAVITDPSSDPDVGACFLRLPQADYAPTWYAQRRIGGAGGGGAGRRTEGGGARGYALDRPFRFAGPRVSDPGLQSLTLKQRSASGGALPDFRHVRYRRQSARDHRRPAARYHDL